MKVEQPAGFRLIRIGALYLLAITCLCGFAFSQDNSEDNEVDQQLTPHQKRLLEILAFGNEFRVLAAGDSFGTIEAFASPDFRDQWATEIKPQFDGDSVLLEDFFSSAVLFAGRIGPTRCILVFYNPWSDAAFCMGADFGEHTILDGAILAGERLRGEPINEKAVMPSWQRVDATIAEGMAKVYVETEKAISRLYPPTDSYQLLPLSFKASLEPLDVEVLPVIFRMRARMTMFQDFLSPEPGSFGAEALANVGSVLEAVQEGDKETFLALTQVDETETATENLFELPELIRSRMAPNFFLTRPGEGAIAALVNPETPQWFVVLTLEAGASGPVTTRADVYKFDLLHTLLNG